MRLTQHKLNWNKQWQLHHQDQRSQDMLHELLCKRHMQHYHMKYLQKYLHTFLYRKWFKEEETLTYLGWACWLVTERPSCHTCPLVMKLSTVISSLKKIQKYINHVTHHLGFAGISIAKNQKILFYQEIQFCFIKNYILIHSFEFF